MKKIIKLSETDLTNIIRRVIEEEQTINQPQTPQISDRVKNLANTIQSLYVRNKPTLSIKSNNTKLNNMSWQGYVKNFKVTPDEINQAQQYIKQIGGKNPLTDPKTVGLFSNKKTTAPGPNPVSQKQPTTGGSNPVSQKQPTTTTTTNNTVPNSSTNTTTTTTQQPTNNLTV
jgi:hypothetical protein